MPPGADKVFFQLHAAVRFAGLFRIVAAPDAFLSHRRGNALRTIWFLSVAASGLLPNHAWERVFSRPLPQLAGALPQADGG